jgi:hypothetical protein
MNYIEWTEALAGYFFAPSRANQPTPFFVDEDALEEIQGSDAVEDLVASVRAYLVPLEGGNPYRNILSVSRSWDRAAGTDAFPGLPLLSIAVLAATRMAREGDMRSTNYYRRYRQLLGIEGEGAPPGYADTFPELWIMFSRWLDTRLQGSLGRSTVKKHPYLANIGFALSQALFREADRQRLTEFFSWLDIGESDEIEDEELLTFFGIWTHRFQRVSPGCVRMLEDETYRQDLLEILRGELDRWEGAVIDDAGRQVSPIVPVIQLGTRTSLRFLARCPDGFPERGVFRSTSGTEFRLEATQDGWYEPAIAASAAALSSGLSLVADGFRLMYEGGNVVPLRQDPALGVWTAAKSVIPDEPHLALADRAMVEGVRRFLVTHADEQVRERPAPVDGWTIFGPFAISHAILDPVSEGLERLVPSIKDRPSLVGGLLLAHQLYLLGGEPDLWIAPSESERPVTIDDHRELVGPLGGRIRLRDLNLPAGRHEIVVGPSRLSMETIPTRGSVRPAGTGSLAWQLDPGPGHAPRQTGPSPLPEGGGVTLGIIGPAILGDPDVVPAHTPAPLILKGGRRYIVLGAASGEIVRFRPPSTPRWMVSLELFPNGFEHTPSFDVAWVLTLRLGRWCARSTGLERQPSRGSDRRSADEVSGWLHAFIGMDVSVQPADLTSWDRFVTFARELGES